MGRLVAGAAIGITNDILERVEALKNAEERVDIILITGGLGPTKDDITKKTMAQYFKSKSFVIHEPTLEVVNQIFKKIIRTKQLSISISYNLVANSNDKYN